MKIVDWSPAQQALSFHTKTILESLGWTTDYSIAEDATTLQDPRYVLAEMIKWPFQRSREILSLFPARPEKVQMTETVDSLFRRDGQLWPELILPWALKRAVRRRVQTLDLRRLAYVISQDVSMRPLAATAVGLGFSHVCLVGHDPDFLREEKKFIERRFVGVRFETVLTGDLTLQPQTAGFLLNSLDLKERKESLQDIAYFNFMGSDAVFVDLFEGGPHKILQDEAARAQLICVRPIEVEWAWWAEAGKKFETPRLVSSEKETQFFQNLDQGLMT